MTVPPSLGFDRSHRHLTADWIKANIDAAVAAVVLEFAAFGARQLLGMPDANAGLLAKALLVVVEAVTSAAALLIYAIRTGTVLRQKLPAFPPLTWNALHALIGFAVGTYVAYNEMDGAMRSETTETSMVASIAIGGALAGALIGAALGSLQALVLRKAVRDVTGWIKWSALAGMTFAAYALILYIGFDQTFATEVMTQLVSFAVAVVSGIIMLPALHGLTPR